MPLFPLQTPPLIPCMFQALVKPELYQVFLMSCYCGLPISFARHQWLVVNMKGKLSRWEVLINKDCCGKSWGHLHLDARDPFVPLGLLSIGGKSLLVADQLGMVEGEQGSLAHQMCDFIEQSPTTYPYCHTYSLLSPNSNTYVQWVLDNFPTFGAELPWNAFGKGHKVKVY